MVLARIAALLLVFSAIPPALATDPATGDAARTGQLGPDPTASVDLALPQHDEAAATCWARASRRKGAPLTRVTASYHVAANGRVRGARVVEPAQPTAAARRCVLAALRAHRFPAGDVTRVLGEEPEAREVRHTFVLARVEAPLDRPGLMQLLGAVSQGGAVANALMGGPTSPGQLGEVFGSGLGTTPGTVRTADPTVRGSLPVPVVRRIVQASLPQLEECYRPLLTRSPGLAGRLDAHVVIDAEGRVTEATLAAGGPSDRVMRRCMTARLRSVRFPRPEGGGVVVADFPLTLAP